MFPADCFQGDFNTLQFNQLIREVDTPAKAILFNYFAGVRNARVSARTVLGRLLFTNPEIG